MFIIEEELKKTAGKKPGVYIMHGEERRDQSMWEKPSV